MKFKEAIQKKIRWDLTPEMAAIDEVIRSQDDIDRISKRIKDQAGFYFYVDVWSCSAFLAICENKINGGCIAQVIDDAPLTEEDLVGAVDDAGGFINMSGWYPISSGIERKIKAIIKG